MDTPKIVKTRISIGFAGPASQFNRTLVILIKSSYASANESLNALLALLKNREVSEIHVLSVSMGTMTRAPLTSENIDTGYDVKTELTYPAVNSATDSWIQVLNTIKVETRELPSDLRWGVIFYGKAKKRLCSIYLDRWGATGYINEEGVLFSSTFFMSYFAFWLRKNFYYD